MFRGLLEVGPVLCGNVGTGAGSNTFQEEAGIEMLAGNLRKGVVAFVVLAAIAMITGFAWMPKSSQSPSVAGDQLMIDLALHTAMGEEDESIASFILDHTASETALTKSAAVAEQEQEEDVFSIASFSDLGEAVFAAFTQSIGASIINDLAGDGGESIALTSGPVDEGSIVFVPTGSNGAGGEAILAGFSGGSGFGGSGGGGSSSSGGSSFGSTGLPIDAIAMDGVAFASENGGLGEGDGSTPGIRPISMPSPAAVGAGLLLMGAMAFRRRMA